VAGGWREGVRSLTSTELYDPATNPFALPGATATMKVARDSHTATIISSGPNHGKILIAGGWAWSKRSKKYVALASTELYDPLTNSFTPRGATPRMRVARARHSATIISSGPNTGKILIAGGDWRLNEPLFSTELYDPLTNRFVPGPKMHSCRTGHIAITMASGPNAGNILIAGGHGDGLQCGKDRGFMTDPLATTELYNPASDTFTAGPLINGAPGDTVTLQLLSAPAAASPRL
jgi:hypothetical protein